MHAEQVDERDSSWEDPHPRFRVCLFARTRGGDYGITDTWDLTDADVLEVLRWAQDRAGDDGLYAVALVQDVRDRGEPERGLVWLVGMDWFDAPDARDERTRARMVARRGRTVVLAEPE